MTDRPRVDRSSGDPAVPAQGRAGAALLTGEPHVSIVIPTRNEADNVEPLVERLNAALTVPAELLFVDDSDDATPDAVLTSAARSPNAVALLHRPAGQRPGGLGGAVLTGFAAARAPRIVVMDGDMQHPPGVVPALVAAAETADADVAVASRYADKGSVGGGLGGVYRRAVSRASGTLARILFPRRVGPVTDPMSGFFAVRTDVVRGSDLHPQGYKILLEVLVRARVGQVVEVPYTFQSRFAGESKASVSEGLRFLWHLLLLRTSTLVRPEAKVARMIGFGAVGLSGVLVNSLLLWVLAEITAVQYLAAAFISLQFSVLWNFVLVDRFVMPPSELGYRTRLGRFVLVANALAPLHIALLYALVSWAGLHYLEANIAAIATVFLLRYAVTSRWIYAQNAFGLRSAGGQVAVGWRSNKARLALAVLLTAVAFPTTVDAAWDGLWEPSAAVPLLIPLATALALLASRLAASDEEPQVHDRQLDALLAAALLAAAAVLVLIAPAPDVRSFRLAATVAFLAAAATLLLGTRTAVRLRWALLLPLVAMEAVAPAWLEAAAGSLARAAADLGVQWSGSGRATLRAPLLADLQWASDAGVALTGAALCAVIAALTCFGVSAAALTRSAVGILAVTAVSVTVVLGSVLAAASGVDATAGTAQLLVNLLLASTVGLLAWVWSRRVSRPAAARQHLPRGRYAAVGLTVAAVVFALAGTTASATPTISSAPTPTADTAGADR